MHIIPTIQPAWGPPGRPEIEDPVIARLTVPVYYAGEHGLIPSVNGILCARLFAHTVLLEMERFALEEQAALAHVGVYNPRKARHADGSPIVPERWSNHAYAMAMDWKGLLYADQRAYLDIPGLKREMPQGLECFLDACRHAIAKTARRAEIVDEGGWIHIGIYHQPATH